jgi:hypothetical protein
MYDFIHIQVFIFKIGVWCPLWNSLGHYLKLNQLLIKDSYEKIEAIIKTFRLDEVKEGLTEIGIVGMNIFWG